MKILRAFKLMAPLGLSPVPMPSCKSSTYHQILLQTTRVLIIILLFLLLIIILLTILTRCTCFCPPSPSPTSPSQSTDPPELKSPLLDKRFSHIQLLNKRFFLPFNCWTEVLFAILPHSIVFVFKCNAPVVWQKCPESGLYRPK